MTHRPLSSPPLTLLAFMSLLAGCAAVGPNYVGPPAVARPAIDKAAFERAALAPVNAAPPPSRWWEAVGDPILTRLVDDAFAASPTLQSAEARVRSARAQQAVNRAGLGPSGGASGRYVRGRVPTGSLLGGAGSASGGGSGSSSGSASASIPDPIRLDSTSVSVDATWEIDLFGGKRRGIESATAAAEAQQAALEDAQVRLAGDVGQAYAQLREAQNRLAFAARTVELRGQTLALARQRRAGGTASRGDIERAEGELAQARAELPGIATMIDQQLDQLAILAGRDPGAYDALLAVPVASQVAQPLPPETVPVGTPADWLRRRPDIREAERTLAARNATIGKNVADLFPSVSILGLIAGTGTRFSDVFRSAPIWIATPSLTWNFLSIPSTRAKIRGAQADRDESIAEYQRTVLAALQDANDSLSKFGRGREALLERSAARGAAARGALIARERYAAGTASLTDALDAERQRLQADDAWSQAAANYLVAYVSLQKSLGLGWGQSPRAGEATATVATLPISAVVTEPALAPREDNAFNPRAGARANLGSVATTASGRSAYATDPVDPGRSPRSPDKRHSTGDDADRRYKQNGNASSGGGNTSDSMGRSSHRPGDGDDSRSSGTAGGDRATSGSGLSGGAVGPNGSSTSGSGSGMGGSSGGGSGGSGGGGGNIGGGSAGSGGSTGGGSSGGGSSGSGGGSR